MVTPESDNEIDDIIWSEIESSDSHGDFVCYAVHAPYKAKYLEKPKLVSNPENIWTTSLLSAI